SDAGPQRVHRRDHGGEPAGQSRPQTRPDHVRGADRRRAAVVRVLYERRDDVPFFVRTIPAQSAARTIRLRRHADSSAGSTPRQIARGLDPAREAPSDWDILLTVYARTFPCD